jgi:hypothetical protein
MDMQRPDALEMAKRHLKREIEDDQKRRDYVVLWRHYNDGEREWDEYHLMTRASAKMVLLSIPIVEPHCQRAKICSMETAEGGEELEDYPWSRGSGS